MNVETINLKETYEVINELKNLNLKIATVDEIEVLLLKLYNHIGVKCTLYKDNIIVRGVSMDKELENFEPVTSQRLSYNPNLEMIEIGRANLEKQPAFYGCLQTEVLKGYECSGFELLPFTNVGYNKHQIVFGKWVLKTHTDFVLVGGGASLKHNCKASIIRNDNFAKQLKYNNQVSKALKIIDTFICKQFNKTVIENEPWNYKISAAYSNILRERGRCGIIYPSVKSSGAGLNIAIFQESVGAGLIEFQKAIHSIFYFRNKDVINEFTKEAISINGKLEWKNTYDKRLPKQILDYYTGLADTNPTNGKIKFIDLN